MVEKPRILAYERGRGPCPIKPGDTKIIDGDLCLARISVTPGIKTVGGTPSNPYRQTVRDRNMDTWTVSWLRANVS